MIQDKIIEILIDATGRLCIKPEKTKFDMIYRSATEVHWDNNKHFLYSPKPREWSYLDWYKHIVSTILTECNCKLILTDNTNWVAVPEDLKENIIAFDKLYFDKWISTQHKEDI